MTVIMANVVGKVYKQAEGLRKEEHQMINKVDKERGS